MAVGGHQRDTWVVDAKMLARGHRQSPTLFGHVVFKLVEEKEASHMRACSTFGSALPGTPHVGGWHESFV